MIDPVSQTMYVVSSELQSSVAISRLHALDITTGAEKFGGPVQIQASVPGTGSGSAGGVLTFNAAYHTPAVRPSLLERRSVYRIWLLSVIKGRGMAGYFPTIAATLQQIDVFCS